MGRGDSFLFQVGAEYKLLDGTTEEIRILDQGSHWRISKKSPGLDHVRPSTIQVWIISKASQSILAIPEEHLPDEKSRQSRKIFYLGVIEQIKDRFGVD